MLIIKNINISSFGKLNDLVINLTPNNNIIYGENEAGKSTLYAFIKAMFYGFCKPGVKRVIQDQIEFNKYKPWYNDRYGGSIVIEHSGIEYLIFHDFNNNYFEIRNLINNTLLDLETNDPRLIGDYFFGMNSTVYEQLVSIRLVDQSKFEDNNYLKEYLLKASYNHSSEIDLSNVENKIINENDIIGTDRISNKKIGVINREIESINKEISDLYRQTSELKRLKQERIEIKNRYKKEEVKFKYLEELLELKQNKLLYIKNKFKRTSMEEYEYLLEIENYLIEAIQNKKDLLTNASNLSSNSKYKAVSLWIILFILSLTVLYFYNTGLAWITNLLVTTILGLVLFMLRYTILNKTKNDSSLDLQEEIDAINDEIERLVVEKNKILSSQNISSIHEYLSLINEESRIYENAAPVTKDLNYTPIINPETIDDDSLIDAIKVKEKLKKSLIEIEYKIRNLEISQLIIRRNIEKLKSLKSDKKDLLNTVNINNTILEGINYAITMVSQKLNHDISRSASNILSKLTSSRYTRLSIDDDLKPLIYDQKLNNYVNVDSLSSGTIQIVYLSLCFAINQVKDNDNKLPIILDESTNFMDSERRIELICYILALSKSRQIIYFTNNQTDLDRISELTTDGNTIIL